MKCDQIRCEKATGSGWNDLIICALLLAVGIVLMRLIPEPYEPVDGCSPFPYIVCSAVAPGAAFHPIVAGFLRSLLWMYGGWMLVVRLPILAPIRPFLCTVGHRIVAAGITLVGIALIVSWMT